jgi:hypothetical protein
MHKHHIVPKHMGGSNDSSNIKELSVEEHAEAHRILFEQHGHWQDKIAWKALSGQISNQEAIKEAQKLANTGDNNPMRRLFSAREKSSLAHKGKKHSLEHIRKIKANSIMCTENNPGKNPSKETKEKMRLSHLGWTNNLLGGIPPSQKDTIWITNGIERKKINKLENIPEGYRKGMK